jgi:alpha-glucosidase
MPFAGFSEAKPWLPVPADHKARAVDVQEADPHSTLAAYRRLLGFRRAHPALAKGRFTLSATGAGYIAFLRTHGDDTILCAFNLTDAPQVVPLPPGTWHPLAGSGFEAAVSGHEAHLPPGQALFARTQEP